MSDLEETLALHIRVNELPEPEREYKFHPKRRWRYDFAWPDRKVAMEVEGGVYSGGRHTRGKGFIADCEKYNEAALPGLRLKGDSTGDCRDIRRAARLAVLRTGGRALDEVPG